MKGFSKWFAIVLAAMFFAVTGCSNASGGGNSNAAGAEASNNGNSDPARYSVTVGEGIENGTVSVDSARASSGETIILTITPNDGYELDALTVITSNNTNVNIVTVSSTKKAFSMPAENVTVSATFKTLPANIYSISVSDGIMNGTVTSDKQSATAGETVTLTVNSNDGYELELLNVVAADNTNVDFVSVNDIKKTFVMPNKNIVVNATFKALPPNVYSISVSDGIINGTVKSDKQSAVAGETVTLTIIPNDGYELKSLTLCSSDNFDLEVASVNITTKTFSMPEHNVIIKATFNAIQYTINLSSTIKNGTVMVNKNPATVGDVVTLTIVPNDGFELDTLSVVELSDNGNLNLENVGENKETFVMPASNIMIVVKFKGIQYKVTLSNSSFGSATVNKDYNVFGEVVTVTVIPNEGYQLRKLIVKAADESELQATIVDAVTAVFTMPQKNVTVEPRFGKIQYNISIAEPVSDGNISSDKNNAGINEIVKLTFTPDAGYELSELKVIADDGRIVSVKEKSFTMPAHNVTIYASFASIPSSFIGTPYAQLPSGTYGYAGDDWNYVYFGDWPQSKKSDSVVVNESVCVVQGAFMYYRGDDASWYAKVNDKYFKVEPIKWRILTNDYGGKKLLFAETVLINCAFYDNRSLRSGTIHPNNYENSRVRAYLNGYTYNKDGEDNDEFINKGFLQTAFTEQEQSGVAKTHVDNSRNSARDFGKVLNEISLGYVCDDTDDKVFLLSVKEITNEEYGFSTSFDKCMARKKIVAPFAYECGVTKVVYTGISSWLLRSPFQTNTGDSVCIVHAPDGDNAPGGSASAGYFGVVPALCVDIE